MWQGPKKAVGFYTHFMGVIFPFIPYLYLMTAQFAFSYVPLKWWKSSVKKVFHRYFGSKKGILFFRERKQSEKKKRHIKAGIPEFAKILVF